MQDQ
jgi:hypothetical protein